MEVVLQAAVEGIRHSAACSSYKELKKPVCLWFCVSLVTMLCSSIVISYMLIGNRVGQSLELKAFGAFQSSMIRSN